MKKVAVSGAFDDLKSRGMRFLQEAGRLGSVHVYLWSDTLVKQATGSDPVFPQAERTYMVEAIRYVTGVTATSNLPDANSIPELAKSTIDIWAVATGDDSDEKRGFCTQHQIEYQVIDDHRLSGFPEPLQGNPTGKKKAVVTGCYDWFHSGHIRFFEEVSKLGELYVVVGHDENVRLLKGEGHPLFLESERRYICGSIRHVHQALVSSGSGWMDAEPEIKNIRPDMYVVNEDGDKHEKRAFCNEHGLQYVVLRRTPKEGLQKRSSTTLRGF